MTDNSHIFPLAPHLWHGSAPAHVPGWQSQAQRNVEEQALLAAEEEARLARKAARVAALAAAQNADASPATAGEAEAAGTGGSSQGASLPDRSASGAAAPAPDDREDIPACGEAPPAARGSGPGRTEAAPSPAPPAQAAGDLSEDDDEQCDEGQSGDEDPYWANWSPPAPRRKPRKGEWTRGKMVLFLRELAASQSVGQAARAVGMSRNAAYKLRARLAATPFALGWEVALEAGLAQLAHAMLDRAVNGVEVPHYHAGEIVGTSRRYDERLSIWLMSNPWKVGRQQLAREFSAEGFDRLLERIEEGPLDWVETYNGQVDQLPGRQPAAPSAEHAGERQGEFLGTRSWYGGGAGEVRPERGRGR